MSHKDRTVILILFFHTLANLSLVKFKVKFNFNIFMLFGGSIVFETLDKLKELNNKQRIQSSHMFVRIPSNALILFS